MNRTFTVATFAISLILIAGGAFYAGNSLISVPLPTSVTPSDILDEAKRRVPTPSLPPKPAGREVVEFVPHEIHVETPQVIMREITGPLGIKIRIPEQTTVQKTLIQQIPKSRFIDANPQEIAAWEEAIKKMQEEYQDKLNAEIARISLEEKHKYAKEDVEIVRGLIKDAIIPLLSSITGLIAAIVTLFRGYPPARSSQRRTPAKKSAA